MSDARTVHARNEHGRVYFTTLHSCNKNTQSLHAQSPTDRPTARFLPGTLSPIRVRDDGRRLRISPFPSFLSCIKIFKTM